MNAAVLAHPPIHSNTGNNNNNSSSTTDHDNSTNPVSVISISILTLHLIRS